MVEKLMYDIGFDVTMCDIGSGLPVPEKMIKYDLNGKVTGAQWCDTVCNHDCYFCPVQKAFNRLFEYEATGLTPEEILKMKARMGDDLR